jgi:sulfite exporter TauE/SafE
VPIAGSTLGALFLAGLLGSVGHCLGMCGPLVALTGIRFAEGQTSAAAARCLPVKDGLSTGGTAPIVRRLPITPTLVYHGCRISVYAIMGAIVGAAGSLFRLTDNVNSVGAAIGIAIGLAVLTLGLGYLGLLPAVARRSGARWWNGATTWALRRPGRSGAAILGALNGILPCGLVYGALLVGAGTGSLFGGALSMLVFGLATFPALALVQSGVGFLTSTRRVWLMRAAGVVVILVGLQLCLRGLAAFGVIPSAYVGGVMLW